MEISLDSLDDQIIHELRRDGRLANTEMARRLGVSEATIRNRIQRLVNEGIIQVSAIVNLSRLGYEFDAYLGIQCNVAQMKEVARALTEMEEVRYVSYVLGRYELMVVGFFRSRAELFAFLSERVGKIPGVGRIETLLVLQVAKRDALFGYWGTPPEHY